jgi:hypothetical protein
MASCAAASAASRRTGRSLVDVGENALAAAFRDHRFAPLTADEFATTRVEVSLLTPAEAFPVLDEADAIARLRPAVDGVVLGYRQRRATFLPQVWESLPDPRQFLAQLKLKAGLPADFWHRRWSWRATEYANGKRRKRDANDAEGTRIGHPGRWWHAIEDERIQCDLCPRDCKLHEGQRGACFVRQNVDGRMVLTTYGRSSGLLHRPDREEAAQPLPPGLRDPVLRHRRLQPGCKFCQNWDISKSKDMDRLLDAASPDASPMRRSPTARQSVAFTYNDPVIFAEYAIDTADRLP